MKGKRYTTQSKIRILRQADGGKTITDVCREHNVSEVTFHLWKKQFGHMDLGEVKRLKELERESGALKNMLAEALLRNGVLEAVSKKLVSPALRRRTALKAVDEGLCSRHAACRSLRLSRSTLRYRLREGTRLKERPGKRMEELSRRHPRYCGVKAREQASGWCRDSGDSAG